MNSGVTHYYGNSTTTATSIASTKETVFKNLHSTNNSTVTFTALWIDNTNPTVTLTAKTDAPSVSSQTATLKCSDNVEVTAYYW